MFFCTGAPVSARYNCYNMPYMAGGSRRRWHIGAATLGAAMLIAGAYVLAQGQVAVPVAQASSATALLQSLATRDSTGDGLPDWEKSLYGIPLDATTTDYFHLGMTDGEAVARGLIVPKAIAAVPATATTSVAQPSLAQYGISATPSPDSLTNAFGSAFITLYLQAKNANGGAPLSGDQVTSVANAALAQLSTVVPAAEFKSASDLTVSGSGPAAMRAFAVAAESVLVKNRPDATMSDLQYFQAVVNGSDSSAAGSLLSLSRSYRATAVGIAALPVPRELASADLAIVNSVMRLSEIYGDFSRADSDPLSAMLALKQYPQVELSAEQAFRTLAGTYVANGVVLTDGQPGSAFVNLMGNVGAANGSSSAP